MTLDDALDLVISRTGHERYRWLCSLGNPDGEGRESHRRLVMEKATGEPQLVPRTEPIPADLQLRAYVASHGCGGCP